MSLRSNMKEEDQDRKIVVTLGQKLAGLDALGLPRFLQGV